MNEIIQDLKVGIESIKKVQIEEALKMKKIRT